MADDSVNGDWTIVKPRRAQKWKLRQNQPSPATSPATEQILAWSPADSGTDSLRESKLKEKLRFSTEKLESSEFFRALIDQIDSPEIARRFRSVLGSEPEMIMVVYGIGSVESRENPRLQLSLALSLKKRLDWIGSLEIFDPVLSATESRVLESLGCSVLAVNEHARRKAEKPILFFMPHCEAELYDNLLMENWNFELLSNVALFGNSFECYDELSEFKIKNSVVNSAKHVLSARKFTAEFKIGTLSEDFYSAFHDSSWHFFSPDVETGLPLIL